MSISLRSEVALDCLKLANIDGHLGGSEYSTRDGEILHWGLLTGGSLLIEMITQDVSIQLVMGGDY